MDTVTAGDEFEIDLAFYNPDGELTTPASATYQVQDVYTDTSLRDAVAIDPIFDEGTLVMKYADTVTVDGDRRRERRRVTVVANYGTDDEMNPKQKTDFFEFDVRNIGLPLWTSRGELEQMFGATNVTKWADVENMSDQDDIQEKILWAVETATDDGEGRLRGAPCGEVSTAPPALRTAVTRLAGVLLYGARGVKDTSDDEGKHRLKYHQDMADKWFRRVQAGQIRISGDDPGVTTFPRVIDDEDDEDEDAA